MSVFVMSLVWRCTRFESHTQKLVLLALADHSDDEGENCWPSISKIARKCSLTKQAVIAHVSRLEERGLLKVDRTENNNHYHINVLRLDTAIGVDETPYQEPVNGLDREVKNRSTALTISGKQHLPTGQQRLPELVNGVDPNHQLTTNDPSVQPPEGVEGDTWNEWLVYRKKLGKVKDWPALFDRQKRWLAEQPLIDRTEIVKQSLRQGWQGLFPLKGSLIKPTNGTPTPGDKMIYQKEFERLVDRMRQIKNGYGEVQSWTTADIVEYSRLRARKNELKKILGIVI